MSAPVQAKWRPVNKGDGLFILGACAAYLIALRLGLYFLSGPEEIAAFWPAAGVLAAALLLRRDIQPILLVVALAANLSVEFVSTRSVVDSFAYSLPNLAECWIAAWLIVRLAGPHPTMARLREVIGIATAALIAGATGSFLSAIVARVLGHSATHFSYVWWFADALSILFLVPIAMTFRNPFGELRQSRISWAGGVRVLSLGAALAVAIVVVLRLNIQPEIAAALRPFIVVVPLLWAAVEFETIGVAVLTALGASVTIYQTARGSGLFAFAADSPTNAVLRAQLFWATSFTMTMVIASILREMNAAQHRQGVAENALRASEERSRLALESASDALLDWNLRSGPIYVSPRYFTMLGYEPGEFEPTEERLLSMIYLDDASDSLRHLLISARPGASRVENEYRLQTKQGPWIWIQIRGRVVERDRDGNPARFVAALLDVTERRKVEEERALLEQQLIHSKERLELAITGVNDGIWDWDLRNNASYYSPRWKQMLGYSDDEVKATRGEWKRLTHPDDFEQAWAAQVAHTEGRTPFYQAEFRMLHKDGTYRWILSRGLAIRDRSGRAVRIAGSHSDITERKRAQEELARSECQLRLFVEHAPAAIAMFDRDMRYLVASRRHISDNHLGNQDVVGRSHYELMPDVPERWKQVHQRCLNGAVEKNEEDIFPHPDGSQDWVHWEVRPWYTATGSIGGIILFSELLTERKKAEEALRRESAFRQVVLEAAALGAWDYHFDTGEVFWDERCRNMYGIQEGEQFDYLAATDRIHPDDRDATREAVSMAIAGVNQGYYRREYRVIWDDGSVHWVASYGQVYFEGENRKAARFLGVNIEITDRKNAEEELRSLEAQLRQAQKMEAVGRLASGVAHDFNNLLMIIRSYTEILQDKLHASDSLNRYVDEVLKAAGRAASLTGQMLAFSRKQMLAPVVLDLNAIVQETGKMLQRLIGEDIEFQVHLHEPLWSVQADADQIGQVLMNLSVNARDAMPRGGTLAITTANVTVQESSNGAYPAYVAPLDYVQLTITDTGVGMSSEVLEHMFEPFYTTKTVGKGTGLGLSTVYGIVKQSGGYVWASSEPGRGTCFTIILPRRESQAAAVLAPGVTQPQRGTETLLVVEDEDSLRESICEFLRGLGYTVLSAGSGQRALSICRQHVGVINLLLSDVIMPRMSGGELSQLLEAEHPQLKTIFMSGYSDDAVVRHGVTEAGVVFLQKPFSLSTLARKVRTALESSKAAR